MLLIIMLAPIFQRKTGIPDIIMLILSGVLVGQYGLNAVKMDDAVRLFSTIGILYIMFLAGLNLDADGFRQTRNRSILFGALTFLTPLALGIPVCRYVLHFSPLSSLLTASMMSTHTLIAYPVVSRMNLTRTEAVGVAVGGTIITDTAVLVMLGVIIRLQENTSGWLNWLWMGISFVLFFVVMFKVVPWAAKWILRRIENEAYSHFILVLALVFLAALLAELTGLERIIGAFTAGLALNRIVPPDSSLKERINFFGQALFIPIFLISIGMMVNIKVLFSGPETLLVASCLIASAFSGKFLAAYITAKLLHYDATRRNVIFGLSSAHAAATLAVVTVGYNIGLVNIHVFNGAVLLILASCMYASMVSVKSMRKLALRQASAPQLSDESQSRLMVSLSNPETMQALADFALKVVAPAQIAPINVVSVVFDDEQVDEQMKRLRKTLGNLIMHAEASGKHIELRTVRHQNKESGIRAAVRDSAATEVLFGAPPSSFFGKFFGNTMKRIMESTNRLLLFYKPVHEDVTMLRVICTTNADAEYGFPNCIRKTLLLAENLHVPVHYYAGNITAVKAIEAIVRQLKGAKEAPSTFFKTLNIVTELAAEAGTFGPRDLPVFIVPREKSVSYHSSEVHSIHELISALGDENPYLVISPNYHDEIKI
jgi:Kef-type K+ transport system membrane component KefB